MKKTILYFLAIVFILYGCSGSSTNEFSQNTDNIVSDDTSIPSIEQIETGYIDSINEWIKTFNNQYIDEIPYEPIEIQNIKNHLDESGIFRYSIAEWITLIIYPNSELSAIECISVRYDPAGQKGPWILRVFNFNEFLLEVTYPNIDSTQADAVSTHYEDTLYSGSWNWPAKGNEGVYTKNEIACDMYRAVDSLIFCITP